MKRDQFVLAVGSSELDYPSSGRRPQEGVRKFFAWLGSDSGALSLAPDLLLGHPIRHCLGVPIPKAKEDLRHVDVVRSFYRTGWSATVPAETIRRRRRRRDAGREHRMLVPPGLELVGDG